MATKSTTNNATRKLTAAEQLAEYRALAKQINEAEGKSAEFNFDMSGATLLAGKVAAAVPNFLTNAYAVYKCERKLNKI